MIAFLPVILDLIHPLILWISVKYNLLHLLLIRALILRLPYGFVILLLLLSIARSFLLYQLLEVVFDVG